ncbi:MAG: lysophospholipid acyltransferase family protein [Balneolales bacterium]
MSEATPGDRIRCVFTVIWFLISLFISTLILITGLVVTLGKAQNFLVKYLGLFIGRTGLFIAGIKLNIHYAGPLPKQAAMYIFNHGSTLDLFVLLSLGLNNIRFVAKREFQFNPFFFILGNLTGQIFIQRQNSQRSIQILSHCCERIKKRDLSVVMGPEGSRHHKGVIGPFKKGAFHMAIDLNYPMVPMYFENTGKLCHGRSLITFKGTVNVYIHPAVDTSQWKKETVALHAEEIRRRYLGWANIPGESV